MSNNIALINQLAEPTCEMAIAVILVLVGVVGAAILVTYLIKAVNGVE